METIVIIKLLQNGIEHFIKLTIDIKENNL